jgi:lipopolysaccharide/colanic/teichoic acid biosynthesis glycosyltransferase
MLFPAGLPVSKRLLDLVVTLLGLVILSPIVILTALCVRIFLGKPVLFRQRRPGYQGKPFSIYKFRTMADATDSAGNLLPDSERLTRLGRFLRALSLDEWPELVNILRGEMSLVGPRPLLMEYLERYSPEQMRRHEVYPGLTGWAQVNGRNAITWEDKFRYDVWYVDHWSFWLDIRIILMTLWKVIAREGISQPGTATTEYFMGNENRNDHQ